MSIGARLDKLEQAVQTRKNELVVAAYVISEFCTGLANCKKGLDPATYRRVETVLRSHVEEVYPWLA